MEDRQSKKFVNCPLCGEIIEVICPVINATVYQVVAKDSWLKARVVDNSNYATTTNECACPRCKKTIYLAWFMYKR
jgi:C4-type Zn-finger protein